jgi:hypothetical protein
LLGARGRRPDRGRAKDHAAWGAGAEGPRVGGRGRRGAAPPGPGSRDEAARRGGELGRGRAQGRARARGRAGSRAGAPWAARRGDKGARAGEGRVGRGRERGEGSSPRGSKSGDHRLQILGHHGEKRERGGGEEVAAREN